MSYEFLQELSEAKLFKNPTKMQDVSAASLADGFFNAAMALQVLRFENPKAAQKYASKTLATGLDGWRGSGTDFNNMAQVLLNQDRYKDKVVFDRRVGVPKMQMMAWLRDISNGRHNPNADRKMFMSMERQLGVSNPGLKAARRLVGDWHRTLPSERTLAMKRIKMSLQHDLSNSDLYRSVARLKEPTSVNTSKEVSGGIPLWAKVAGAGVLGYQLGKKIVSW